MTWRNETAHWRFPHPNFPFLVEKYRLRSVAGGCALTQDWCDVFESLYFNSKALADPGDGVDYHVCWTTCVLAIPEENG